MAPASIICWARRKTPNDTRNSQGVSEKSPETPSRRLFRHFRVGKLGAIPHNIAQRLTDVFTPSAVCSFLDVPPVRLRNLQFASDANPSRHPSRELCGIAPRFSPAKPSVSLLELTKKPLVLSPLPFSDTPWTKNAASPYGQRPRFFVFGLFCCAAVDRLFEHAAAELYQPRDARL